jgi:hypothetical protein
MTRLHVKVSRETVDAEERPSDPSGTTHTATHADGRSRAFEGTPTRGSSGTQQGARP